MAKKKFKKGSPEAKAFMAKLRGMRNNARRIVKGKKPKVTRKRNPIPANFSAGYVVKNGNGKYMQKVGRVVDGPNWGSSDGAMSFKTRQLAAWAITFAKNYDHTARLVPAPAGVTGRMKNPAASTRTKSGFIIVAKGSAFKHPMFYCQRGNLFDTSVGKATIYPSDSAALSVMKGIANSARRVGIEELYTRSTRSGFPQ